LRKVTFFPYTATVFPDKRPVRCPSEPRRGCAERKLVCRYTCPGADRLCASLNDKRPPMYSRSGLIVAQQQSVAASLRAFSMPQSFRPCRLSVLPIAILSLARPARFKDMLPSRPAALCQSGCSGTMSEKHGARRQCRPGQKSAMLSQRAHSNPCQTT